ncbi:armadillo repeat-containing protein 8-like isoform X2 [Anthonomus grandis grandis]|uniref:armadillo repeat-containing protein 8-like isoform X2 n=1 Tax=Anthonomus grandis grandis TaxID=2921223 RepID=UPI0021661EC1|nr:armadillo repeat-containing protein 8-like isoform X2 [Anthonomus grandis grandis]
MLDKMQPFTAFMNVESSRSYIDDLYSQDSNRCLTSIMSIKNSVIGSNRQKESVIAQGIVPRLIYLLKDATMKTTVRTEAAVTIGSLAKGTGKHVELLINAGIVQTLLDLLDEQEPKLVDACLCCLRTLASQEFHPINSKFEVKHMQKLLSLISPTESLQRMSCIATILTSTCKTSEEQNSLCTIGAPAVLASLLSVDNCSVRVPVATCLASMCFNNTHVAREIVNTSYRDVKVIGYLSMMISRDKPVEMQLEAARCLTNLHRAGAISAFDPVVTYKTLPCLVRLCQVEHTESQRSTAAETLAYLTEVDSNLQQIAAISNQLVTALVDLLVCNSVAARTAAFRAFASLGANDEDIRKRIIDTKCLMEQVVEGLADPNKEVNLASVRCLHSLSRSVQQLRTTFQDHSVWKPLMTLLQDDPSPELLLAASSTLCNLLLEFSPAKEPIIQQGAVQLLANLTGSTDPALRLNGIWALMNLAFQAEQRVKSQILTCLGTDQIFRLLADSDPRILMKTLGLLRNLVSPRTHTDTMMALHGTQVMQGVVLVLEGPHSPEVKEQALLILSNIADGERAKDHIMINLDILKKLVDYMTHPAPCLQESAVFCIGNLSRKGEQGALERQTRLRDLGVVNILQQLMGTSDTILFNRVKATLSNFTDV